MEYIKLVFNIMAALLTKDMDLCCRCLLDSNPADFNHKQSQLAHKIRAPLLPVSCHHLHNQPLSHRPTSDWPKASPLPLFHWLWVCWGKKLTFSPPGGMVRPLTNNTKPLRGRPLRSTGFNRYFCWVSSPPRGRAAHHNQTSEGLCTARLVGRHRGMLQQQTVAKPVGLGEKKKKKKGKAGARKRKRERKWLMGKMKSDFLFLQQPAEKQGGHIQHCLVSLWPSVKLSKRLQLGIKKEVEGLIKNLIVCGKPLLIHNHKGQSDNILLHHSIADTCEICFHTSPKAGQPHPKPVSKQVLAQHPAGYWWRGNLSNVRLLSFFHPFPSSFFFTFGSVL